MTAHKLIWLRRQNCRRLSIWAPNQFKRTRLKRHMRHCRAFISFSPEVTQFRLGLNRLVGGAAPCAQCTVSSGCQGVGHRLSSIGSNGILRIFGITDVTICIICCHLLNHIIYNVRFGTTLFFFFCTSVHIQVTLREILRDVSWKTATSWQWIVLSRASVAPVQ